MTTNDITGVLVEPIIDPFKQNNDILKTLLKSGKQVGRDSLINETMDAEDVVDVDEECQPVIPFKSLNIHPL